MSDADDDLLARLRAADPARSLQPLDDDRMLRMTNLASSQPTGTTPPRKLGRPWLFGLAGATGLAAVAFAAVSVLSPGVQTTEPALRIGLPADGGAASMCMAVDPELLNDWNLAFEATARTVTPDLVTLDVTDVFRGEPGAVVEVAGHELTDSDFSGFAFTEGGDYLITVLEPESTTEPPQIVLCGFSGPASPELRAVYEEAFR